MAPTPEAEKVMERAIQIIETDLIVEVALGSVGLKSPEEKKKNITTSGLQDLIKQPWSVGGK